MKRQVSRKKLAAILVVLFAGYLLSYAALRERGDISRWQNHGQPAGQTVRARHEPWDGLFVQMTQDSSKARWLTPVAVVFRDRYKVWNVLFFPLCRAEELFWNTWPTDQSRNS